MVCTRKISTSHKCTHVRISHRVARNWPWSASASSHEAASAARQPIGIAWALWVGCGLSLQCRSGDHAGRGVWGDGRPPTRGSDWPDRFQIRILGPASRDQRRRCRRRMAESQLGLRFSVVQKLGPWDNDLSPLTETEVHYQIDSKFGILKLAVLGCIFIKCN